MFHLYVSIHKNTTVSTHCTAPLMQLPGEPPVCSYYTFDFVQLGLRAFEATGRPKGAVQGGYYYCHSTLLTFGFQKRLL